MALTFQEMIDAGASMIVVYTAYQLLMNFFSKKIERTNDNDIRKAEQDDKIFNMFTKMFQENEEVKIRTERNINEVKKLILNKTNMDVSDFEILIKIYYQFICLSLENDINKIIYDNHIVEATKILTNRKMENLLDVKLTEFNHIISGLHFDATIINELIDFNKMEKQYIKNIFAEAIDLYIKTEDKKQYTTYRYMHESMKSIQNSFISNLHEVIEKGTN